MSFPTKRSEFNQFCKTRFWEDYTARLANLRTDAQRKLNNIGSKIGTQMTYGELLQYVIRNLDQIESLPAKIVAEE